MEKNSVDLFKAAPYMFMLVLRKDALFHCIDKIGELTEDKLTPEASKAVGMLDKQRDVPSSYHAVIFHFLSY
jgi:hypothetical protein